LKEFTFPSESATVSAVQMTSKRKGKTMNVKYENREVFQWRLLAVLLMVGSLWLAATINGGTALASATWADSVVTWLKSNILASTAVILIAVIMFIFGVLQASQGKGYLWIVGILTLLIIAIIAPTWVTQIATSVPTANELVLDLSAYRQ
jgi:uncharacterized Tic20 family protein